MTQDPSLILMLNPTIDLLNHSFTPNTVIVPSSTEIKQHNPGSETDPFIDKSISVV